MARVRTVWLRLVTGNLPDRNRRKSLIERWLRWVTVISQEVKCKNIFDYWNGYRKTQGFITLGLSGDRWIVYLDKIWINF